MELCPYCGEEVPADSAKCWKCGTELSEGEGKSPSDELEVPDEDDEGGGAKRQEMIRCPHCEAPCLKKARRCKECGRSLHELEASYAATAWTLGTWVVVLGVALAAGAGVVSYSLKRHRSAVTRTPLAVKYADLERQLRPLQPGGDARKREVFTRDFETKWVKWTGFVATSDADTLHVGVARAKGSKKADCDVEFLSDARDDLRDLKPDQEIVYSARLLDFGKDGMAFTLGEGLVEK